MTRRGDTATITRVLVLNNQTDASINLECKAPYKEYKEEQPNVGATQSLDPIIPKVGCVVTNHTDSIDLECKEPCEEQPNI